VSVLKVDKRCPDVRTFFGLTRHYWLFGFLSTDSNDRNNWDKMAHWLEDPASYLRTSSLNRCCRRQ